MRVSLAAVLEEDLAGGLRRVDTHAICHGAAKGQARQRNGEKGQARPGTVSQARRPHHS